MSWRIAAAVGAIFAIMVAGAAQAAGTLDRIAQDKAIRIAFREDAPPFSSKGKDSEPVGFMVDLCRAVVKKLAEQLKLPALQVVYVPVTAASRFAAIKEGKADLLCEPTTATLSRREVVDFSIPTFVDGASLLIREGGPKDLRALAGKKIGVLAGTTTQEELNSSLKAAGVQSEVVPAKTHEEGLAMLDDGKISAYFGDRAILTFLVQQSKDPKKLLLAENYLTVEPYALALPRGDEDFRLAIDRALSHLYRDGDIVGIFEKSFGGKARPSGIVETMYMISGLPD
jgi:ABC-type amino acid transport substrate-binding protein